MLWSTPVEFSLATDGEFFYAPKNVDFGNEYADTNTCDAIIENLVFTRVFNDAKTLCTVTVGFDVTSESAKVITKVQYKLNTDNIWRDLVYPANVPFNFNAAVNQFITISLRAICPNTYGGIIKTDIVDTIPDPLPGDPPPHVDNSRITNNTALIVIFYLRVNGVIKSSGRLNPGQYVTGPIADATGATVTIETPGTSLSYLTDIESNGARYYGNAISMNTLEFLGVNIVNGMNITLT